MNMENYETLVWFIWCKFGNWVWAPRDINSFWKGGDLYPIGFSHKPARVVVAVRHEPVSESESMRKWQLLVLHSRIQPEKKLEKFNGSNFKRWQQKMLFYLTTLSLEKFLKEDALSYTKQESDVEKLAAVDAWKHSDFLCRNYVLNGLDNTLYNVYCNAKSAKELWESLDTKYKIEDAGTKKFIAGRFLDYKMVDSKTVILQVQELQIVLSDIHAERMKLSESFQVAALIEKLPPSWKDFKNYLKHKRKEMKLKDIIVRLRIEEDNRKSEKRSGTSHSMESKVNTVEEV
ncbi:uncharacterized protein LOC111397908 [Olea europaea var. sylvestris]|uniref:uncharacterized protein LOC111397908 n=1 Tax=Olea europaea var. sylvestris TaxID=158386 RepID=UPI000C1D04F3|nr:uncharacterized protein LOC111397908 [Olea europaea var. sylvestris]